MGVPKLVQKKILASTKTVANKKSKILEWVRPGTTFFSTYGDTP